MVLPDPCGRPALIEPSGSQELGPKMKAWIRAVPEEDANRELRTEFEWVRNTRGRLSNVMRVHSLDPGSIRLHMDLYLHLMFGKSTLTRLEREMIAVVVSAINKCHYCVVHHGEALLAHSKDPVLMENLTGLGFSNLPHKQVSILEYVTKLTKNPGEISEKDVERMRNAGVSDEEILRVNLITSYFNFVNRIVSGLGVPLEEKEARAYKY